MADEWKELAAMPTKRTNHIAEYIDSQDVIFVYRLDIFVSTNSKQTNIPLKHYKFNIRVLNL